MWRTIILTLAVAALLALPTLAEAAPKFYVP